MEPIVIVLGIVILLLALGLSVLVLMQSGKDSRLSGAIAGGAETFFGKTKGSSLDKKLSKLTSIVAVVFTLLVLVSYLMQDTTNFSGYDPNGSVNLTVGQETEAAGNGETEDAGVEAEGETETASADAE